MSMGLFGDPLPPVDDTVVRALVGELREELAHPVNLSRALYNLTDGERKTLRKIMRQAREQRDRPDIDEVAATFGRRGRL